MFVFWWTPVKAHVDYQANTQDPQIIIITGARGIPNEKVVGNFG